MITKEMDVYLSDYYKKLLVIALKSIEGNSVSVPSEEWTKILHGPQMHVSTCESDGKFTISLYPLG